MLMIFLTVSGLASEPKASATHLALAALRSLNGQTPTPESLTAAASAMLPPDTPLPKEFEDAIGELYVIHSCYFIL
jgi:hypothetical protein